MGRIILRFRGRGPLPDAVVEQVAQLPDTRIVERTRQMLLVDGPEEPVRKVIGAGPDWLVVQERGYARPDARPTIKR